MILNLGPSLVCPIPLKPEPVCNKSHFVNLFYLYCYFQILLNLFWHTDKKKKFCAEVNFLDLISNESLIECRAPDKLRICTMKTSKNTCIIRSECTITHTYCCVSKLSKFGAYVYAVNDNTVVYINNTFLSLRNSP